LISLKIHVKAKLDENSYGEQKYGRTRWTTLV